MTAVVINSLVFMKRGIKRVKVIKSPVKFTLLVRIIKSFFREQKIEFASNSMIFCTQLENKIIGVTFL